VEEMVFIVQYKYKQDKRVLIVNSADETSQFDETMFCTNLFSFFSPNISLKYTLLQH